MLVKTGPGVVEVNQYLSPMRVHKAIPLNFDHVGRRHGGAMDQGRQGRGQVDPALMSILRQPKPWVNSMCAGLQSPA